MNEALNSPSTKRELFTYLHKARADFNEAQEKGQKRVYRFLLYQRFRSLTRTRALCVYMQTRVPCVVGHKIQRLK